MSGPHHDQPLLTAGAELANADAAVVLLHGRGASARSILGIAEEFDTGDVAYLAPQAAGHSWYPNSFMAPTESNEPHLTSALAAVENAISRAAESGLGIDRTAILGFSQGACLGSEFVVRNPDRYGGLIALSGGLIGPEETKFDDDGSLDGTPAFVGCSDEDPHIPLERVHETTATFRSMGADVTERIYEGMGHDVNQDELDHATELIAGLTG